MADRRPIQANQDQSTNKMTNRRAGGPMERRPNQYHEIVAVVFWWKFFRHSHFALSEANVPGNNLPWLEPT